MPKALTITIDGPAAAGKSTAAKGLAQGLGYVYLDTGALYRAMAWKMLDNNVDIEDEGKVAAHCKTMRLDLALNAGETEVWIDGINATPQLRRPEVSQASSRISVYPAVREKLLSIQRGIGEKGGVVAEGRDVGTVVFPKAELKFYLDAQVKTRGRRRYHDLLKSGEATDLGTTTRGLSERDRLDRERIHAPLQAAADAILLDSTYLNADEVLEKMFEAALRAGARP